MQVTETKSEGLKREYAILVTAADLETKTTEKLEEIRKDFHMKGFRKGKAPLALVKRHFGKSVLGEVVQETVETSVSEHLEEKGHRPAQQPDVKIANENFDEGDDLNVEVAYECLPEVPDLDYEAISLERKVVAVEESAVEEAMGRLAKSAVDYEARDEGAAAEDGDQVMIDFLGKIDGEAFDGGEGEDFPLVLGSGSFIPGFEEQLVGTKAGDAKDVNVAFPADYGAENLAGKDAVFEVTVKEVRAPKDAAIDDELAKRFGADDLDGLKEQLENQIKSEFSDAARSLVKRRLLDKLDDTVSFELPQSLVDVEAKSIAQQLWMEENQNAESEDGGEDGGESGGETPTAPPQDLEPTDEHVKLAERRVRLGLLLAELGQRAEVEITDAELGQAIMARARNFPGQEREFFEFVRSNREALEQIRAPLFEDKVVDMILEKAQVTDIEVTKNDLEKEIEALDEES